MDIHKIESYKITISREELVFLRDFLLTDYIGMSLRTLKLKDELHDQIKLALED